MFLINDLSATRIVAIFSYKSCFHTQFLVFFRFFVFFFFVLAWHISRRCHAPFDQPVGSWLLFCYSILHVSPLFALIFSTVFILAFNYRAAAAAAVAVTLASSRGIIRESSPWKAPHSCPSQHLGIVRVPQRLDASERYAHVY